MKPVYNTEITARDLVRGSVWKPIGGGMFAMDFGNIVIDAYQNSRVHYHYLSSSYRVIGNFWHFDDYFLQWARRIK